MQGLAGEDAQLLLLGLTYRTANHDTAFPNVAATVSDDLRGRPEWRGTSPEATQESTGIVGVAAVLAAGHLVAAFVDPAASPFLAVGNSAIDLTPLQLKDFAVRTFGTYDKLVLLSGMALFLVAIAATAGALGGQRPLAPRWPCCSARSRSQPCWHGRT
ncbi:MAG TPA: hypothetical protein VL652_03730 [Kutzneria sp.]|nr:hypothetical protein [Kutzneria sp.]